MALALLGVEVFEMGVAAAESIGLGAEASEIAAGVEAMSGEAVVLGDIGEALAGNSGILGQVARGAENIAIGVEQVEQSLVGVGERVAQRGWNVAEQVIGEVNMHGARSIASNVLRTSNAISGVYGTIVAAKKSAEFFASKADRLRQHAERLQRTTMHYEPPKQTPLPPKAEEPKDYVIRPISVSHHHHGGRQEHPPQRGGEAETLFDPVQGEGFVFRHFDGPAPPQPINLHPDRDQPEHHHAMYSGYTDVLDAFTPMPGHAKNSTGEVVPRQPMAMGLQPANADVAETPMGPVHVGYSDQHRAVHIEMPNLY
jgi:hypothetical protein